MDTFDDFNQTPEETETRDTQNTNNQEDDLFGSDYANHRTTAASTNPFSNEQREDPSWTMDDNLTDTTTPQTNLFDDDNLDNLVSAPSPLPQATLFDDNLFTTQSNIDELDSYTTSNLPPTVDEILYDDTTRRQSENSLSFNMFSNPVPSPSPSNPFSSTENVSPLQAFTARRQQELAEMEVIEKQKIEELRQQGKRDLERWYQDRRSQMERKLQSMKQEENVSSTQALEKSDKDSCDWAKVIRFLDFSQGTQITKQKRDLTRMRTIIIQAKRDKDNRVAENGV